MCRAQLWEDAPAMREESAEEVPSRPISKQPSTVPRPPVISSGVEFFPPSNRLWRIGGRWYDFTPFMERHPGGAEVLRLSRDRFEDSTFVFESHHNNYSRARSVIAKYEVAPPDTLLQRRGDSSNRVAGADKPPSLLPDDAFYSKVRQRLTDHLRKVGYADGGPTTECILLFWCNFVAFCASWGVMYFSGTFISALVFGAFASLLGAFGHNWVHQPKYRFWAFLSLDTIGFSSTCWFREHVLQHHMYTNTPWDNHFRGTDPFLITDPTIKRGWVQEKITPYINPLILTFGLVANYSAHLIDMVKGNEEWRLWKLILPLNIALMIFKWKIRGVFLSYTWMALLGIRMEACFISRNPVISILLLTIPCSGFASHVTVPSRMPFQIAPWYLWLNYHTVHHLFPKLDFSHHAAAQTILMQTCAEFNIPYVAPDSPIEIYKQMVHSFTTPQSLYKEIMVYAGGA